MITAAITVVTVMGVAALPTGAVVPGQNGKITFTSTRDGINEIYSMNADGSGQTRLTSNPAIDREPD
ncbi:hypothetical protein [Nonomuraea sp. NPDC049480]|uniref:hypothetical protein n=1 Tax=Nonomuraea sp. NPDC049480 TaxID=3364353 RepID=UPI00378BCD6C